MNKNGQSIIEFCFSVTIFFIMVYGLVKTVSWMETDLAERRYDHDAVLTMDTPTVNQVNPNFHQTRPLDVVIFKK